MTDRDVHADDAGAFLIDDRVDRDCGLAGAAVADDQLSLSSANRNHGVDRLDSGLERLVHWLADDDSGRLRVNLAGVCGVDRALVVERASERIHNATDELRSNRYFEHSCRAADFVALFQLEIIAEDDGADVVLFEVQGEGSDFLAGFGGCDLEHLAGHRFGESVNAGDTVFDFED